MMLSLKAHLTDILILPQIHTAHIDLNQGGCHIEFYTDKNKAVRDRLQSTMAVNQMEHPLKAVTISAIHTHISGENMSGQRISLVKGKSLYLGVWE